MGLETFIFAILPMAIATVAMAASIYALIRRPSGLQVTLTFVSLPSLGLSFLYLLSMARGAWPTYIPHVVMAGAVPLVVIQLWRATRRLPNQPLQRTEAAARGFEVQQLSARGPGR